MSLKSIFPAACLFAAALLLLASPHALSANGGSGERSTIGSGADSITVVTVSGTPYEMGLWEGKLLAPEISGCLSHMMNAVPGAETLLDEGVKILWPYVPDRYTQELQGMADGCAQAGHPEVTFQALQRLAAVADVSELGCSLYVAFGKATANGHTYQMRNLDWSMEVGAQDYPVITVYKPDTGHGYVNVGFAGLTGCIAGMSDIGIAASEIMGNYWDSESLNGFPFPLLLRYAMEEADNLDEAVSVLQNAKRTNDYHYALCDPQAGGNGTVLFTGPNVFVRLTPGQPLDNYPGLAAPWNLKKPYYEPLNDVVYWKNHNGSGNELLHGYILSRYGSIGDEEAVQIARDSGTDGTVMSVVYDATDLELWASFAEGPTTPAQFRQYAHLKLER